MCSTFSRVYRTRSLPGTSAGHENRPAAPLVLDKGPQLGPTSGHDLRDTPPEGRVRLLGQVSRRNQLLQLRLPATFKAWK